MYIKSLKEKLSRLTEQCGRLIEENDKYRRERDIYKTKYNNLFNLVFDEKLHKIIAVCIIDGEEYIIYTTDFIHEYESAFYFKYASYFEMKFIMAHLSYSNFKPVACAEIEIKDKSLYILNLDAYCFRCGYGGKLFEYIEKYAQANELAKIWGKIDIHTPIGLDNLIRFYKKQGCTIVGEEPDLKFRKQLDKSENL